MKREHVHAIVAAVLLPHCDDQTAALQWAEYLLDHADEIAAKRRAAAETEDVIDYGQGEI